MATSNTPFRLLSLPAELRLRIYDYMLSPPSTQTDAPLRTRISWMGFSDKCPTFMKGKAHEVDSAPCPCRAAGTAWLPGPPSHLSPAILVSCKQIYAEALPRLYESRMWEAVNFRTFGTQHESYLEKWWIMDRFLASLSAASRRHVKYVRVPMLVSLFETYGCAEAFRSIQARLPSLKHVEVQCMLSGVLRRDVIEREDYVFTWGARLARNNCLVWPVMVFTADVRLVSLLGSPPAEIETQAERDFWDLQQSEVDKMRYKRHMRTLAKATDDHKFIELDGLADSR